MFAEESGLWVDVLVVEEATKRASGLMYEHLSVCEDLFGDLFGLRDDEHERTGLAHLNELLADKHQRRTYVL